MVSLIGGDRYYNMRWKNGTEQSYTFDVDIETEIIFVFFCAYIIAVDKDG